MASEAKGSTGRPQYTVRLIRTIPERVYEVRPAVGGDRWSVWWNSTKRAAVARVRRMGGEVAS